MISILKENQPKEYPKPRSMTPPPWITIPAVAGTAAVGGLTLGKKAVEYPLKKIEGLRRKSVEQEKKDKEAVSKAYEKFDRSGEDNPKSRYPLAEKIKKLNREENIERDKDKETISKAYEKVYGVAMENLNIAISLGLLHEMTKVRKLHKPLKKIYLGAATKAMIKGQEHAIRDPSDSKRPEPFRRAASNLAAGAKRY